MQPAAFLCVICAICGRIITQEYSIKPHNRNPNKAPADLADYADKPQNNRTPKTSLYLNQPVFLCVIMQLAAFLCVICVICGRITRKRTLSILLK